MNPPLALRVHHFDFHVRHIAAVGANLADIHGQHDQQRAHCREYRSLDEEINEH